MITARQPGAKAPGLIYDPAGLVQMSRLRTAVLLLTETEGDGRLDALLSGVEVIDVISQKMKSIMKLSEATRPSIEPMNMTSLEQDVREFEVAGLTPVDSRLIDAPRVGESHASLECKVTTHFQLKDSEGKDLNTWMVLGEVVGVHVSPNSIVDGIYRTAIPRPILRGGGPGDYFEITDLALFDMPRPKS